MSMTLLVTVGIVLVVVAVAAGLTASSRRPRPLVLGLGLAALVAGLYLTGMTDLIVNGIGSLIAWFQRTAFDTVKAWGVGLAVAGVLALIGGSFLPKEPREPKAKDASKPAQPPRVAGSSSPAVGAGKHAAPTGSAPQAKAQAKGADPEDAEIEALLRKRGIM